ncbi:MAG: ABC transporter permease [Myxococcota bacterium]
MFGFVGELRLGLRELRRTPAFTVVAALVLALGIGLNTTVFSAYRAILLEPLAFEEPDRLVAVWGTLPDDGSVRVPFSWSRYQALDEAADELEDLAASTYAQRNLEREGESVITNGRYVSGNFLSTLRVKPALGRDFSAAEAEPGGDNVVILGHGAHLEWFGGAPDVLEQTVVFDGTPYRIIGVAPADIFPWGRTQVFFPRLEEAPALTSEASERGDLAIMLVGRLAQGQALPQAQDRLATAARAFGERNPGRTDSEHGVKLVPLAQDLLGELEGQSAIGLAAVIFVLLIACINVGNLLLSRFASRWREVAIRTSLGATRWAIVRQFFVESMVLAALGGLLGTILSVWGVAALSQELAGKIPRTEGMGLDTTTLLYTVAATVGTGLFVGSLSTLRATGVDVNTVLKDASHATIGSGGQGRLRRILLGAQIALSTVLLCMAGMMIESTIVLQQRDLGFETEQVFGAHVRLEPTEMRDAAERFASLPGVERSAVVARGLPLGFDVARFFCALDDGKAPELSARPLCWNSAVSPDYFEILGIPVLAGRTFTVDDREGSPDVAMVNETFVARMLGGREAVGQRILFGHEGDESIEIVGVVGDAYLMGPAFDPEPQIYLPFEQNPEGSFSIIASSTQEPASLTAALDRIIAEIDPNATASDGGPLDQRMEPLLWGPRFVSVLYSIFGVSALALALIGLWGLVAYALSQRTGEIAVRMVLGASQRSVLGLAIRDGLWPTMIGCFIGCLAAVASADFVVATMPGVVPPSPAVFVGIVALMFVAATVASLGPAHGATRIDPATALRGT